MQILLQFLKVVIMVVRNLNSYLENTAINIYLTLTPK